MYDSARIPYYQPVNVRPFGLVRIEGKRWPVHKVVYEWSTPQIEKSPTYRLYNQCRDTLCCNPEHWLMRDREAEEAAKAASAAAPVDPELMLRRDCEELLEALLAVTQPRCFDDIQNHPYMMDFQPAVIKEVLRGIGKDHLCQ
jgi:hypothetical protein